jgi:hypothetical protein
MSLEAIAKGAPLGLDVLECTATGEMEQRAAVRVKSLLMSVCSCSNHGELDSESMCICIYCWHFFLTQSIMQREITFRLQFDVSRHGRIQTAVHAAATAQYQKFCLMISPLRWKQTCALAACLEVRLPRIQSHSSSLKLYSALEFFHSFAHQILA